MHLDWTWRRVGRNRVRVVKRLGQRVGIRALADAGLEGCARRPCYLPGERVDRDDLVSLGSALIMSTGGVGYREPMAAVAFVPYY